MPSTAGRFQGGIRVWCTPCFAASSTTVRSPFSASSATLALNSALQRRLFPAIRFVLAHRRTKLRRISGFRGPPQLRVDPALEADRTKREAASKRAHGGPQLPVYRGGDAEAAS